MIVNHQTGECLLPDCFCHEAQRIKQSSSTAISAPDFTHEWDTAPRWATRTTEQECAEYWFLRGGLVKERELLATMNSDLREMQRVARERIMR